jgi:hypothetical protein
MAVVVECVGRKDLGGRGTHSMGFMDAWVVSWDERGLEDEHQKVSFSAYSKN